MSRRLLCLLWCLLLARPVMAQVALDTTGTDGGSGSASSASFSHVVSGSNTYLLVACYIATITVSSITFNGVALSSIGTDVANDGGTRLDVWGLKSPASGAHTVSVTFSGANNEVCASASFTGVDQVTPIGTVVHDAYAASGTTHSHNTTNGANGLVWDAFTAQNGAGTLTPNGGQTTQWGPITAASIQGIATSKTGTGTVSTGYSWPNDFWRWAHVTVPLNAAAVGGGGGSCNGSLLRGVGC